MNLNINKDPEHCGCWTCKEPDCCCSPVIHVDCRRCTVHCECFEETRNRATKSLPDFVMENLREKVREWEEREHQTQKGFIC